MIAIQISKFLPRKLLKVPEKNDTDDDNGQLSE